MAYNSLLLKVTAEIPHIKMPKTGTELGAIELRHVKETSFAQSVPLGFSFAPIQSEDTLNRMNKVLVNALAYRFAVRLQNKMQEIVGNEPYVDTGAAKENILLRRLSEGNYEIYESEDQQALGTKVIYHNISIRPVARRAYYLKWHSRRAGRRTKSLETFARRASISQNSVWGRFMVWTRRKITTPTVPYKARTNAGLKTAYKALSFLIMRKVLANGIQRQKIDYPEVAYQSIRTTFYRDFERASLLLDRLTGAILFERLQATGKRLQGSATH